jgi:hypothetical protein
MAGRLSSPLRLFTPNALDVLRAGVVPLQRDGMAAEIGAHYRVSDRKFITGLPPKGGSAPKSAC